MLSRHLALRASLAPTLVLLLAACGAGLPEAPTPAAPTEITTGTSTTTTDGAAPTETATQTRALTLTAPTEKVALKLRDVVTVPVRVDGQGQGRTDLSFRFERVAGEGSDLTRATLSADAVTLGGATTSVDVRVEGVFADLYSPDATYRMIAVSKGRDVASTLIGVHVEPVDVRFSFGADTVTAAPGTEVTLDLLVSADSTRLVPFTFRPALYLPDMGEFGELVEPEREYTVDSLPAHVPVRFRFKTVPEGASNDPRLFDFAMSGLEDLGSNRYVSRWLRASFTWQPVTR
ncbi:hypothetical protein [Deinococcus pimensis]|uniref:hypothetical protein n=1 Tax=Deinococcus pimensis TaxID=309888 RepID=UPI000481F069|nr:hypothetical protein [Deinococcus pimensis]